MKTLHSESELLGKSGLSGHAQSLPKKGAVLCEESRNETQPVSM
jgi:hypothetical protein